MKHKCSVCGQAYESEYEKGKKLLPHFPFCSARCKAIDLGKWFSEEYRITTELPNTEFMTEQEREVFAQLLVDMGEVDDVGDQE